MNLDNDIKICNDDDGDDGINKITNNSNYLK